MRRILHMTVGAMALCAVCSAPVAAFQKMPVAPAPTQSAPSSIGQGLTFDVERRSGESGKKKGDKRKFPGVGALDGLPKMNFGLELLYGAKEEQDSTASPYTDWGADDIKVLGTIKRRF